MMKAILIALNLGAAVVMFVLTGMGRYVEAVELNYKLAEMQRVGVLSTNALPASFTYETKQEKAFDDFSRLSLYLRPTKQFWPSNVACVFFIVNAVLLIRQLDSAY